MGRFGSHSSSSSSKDPAPTCPVHSLDERAQSNLAGDLDFFQVSRIIAGVCSGIVLLVMLFFKHMHATHLSNPSEQVKIMRISGLITAYSLFSLLAVCFPHASVYMAHWLEVIEGAALGSFFLLLCDYISPNHTQREVFFATKRRGGVKWFMTRWTLIFQYPVVAFILAIVANITEAAGVYCEWSNSIHFASIWIMVIGSISLGASVMAIFQFYKLLKVDLAQHRPLLKLTAFKLVVGLTFIQNLIFQILRKTGALKETDYLTFSDINIGIPNLVICLEMIPICFFFVYAYPWKVYYVNNATDTESVQGPEGGIKFTKPYQGGPLGIYAWLQMLNPSDTLQAILFAFHRGDEKKKQPSSDNYYLMNENTAYGH